MLDCRIWRFALAETWARRSTSWVLCVPPSEQMKRLRVCGVVSALDESATTCSKDSALQAPSGELVAARIADRQPPAQHRVLARLDPCSLQRCLRSESQLFGHRDRSFLESSGRQAASERGSW